MSRKSFEELLLSGRLPSPAGIGMKILEMTRSESFSIEEMGNTIRLDSALTGRILRMANSAANSGVQPATTVQEAIMRLGSRPVRDLALAFSLISERRTAGCEGFDYERYWAKSLARAVTAQSICGVLSEAGERPPAGQEAYICGLLGEIGILALGSVYPERYAELIRGGFMRDPDGLARIEAESFGIDHREVAGNLLSEWGLPEQFVNAVRGYDRPPVATSRKPVLDMTWILRQAEILAAVFVTSSKTSRASWERYTAGLDRLMQSFDWDEPRLERFFDGCVREWASWGEEIGIVVEKDQRYKKARAAALEASGVVHEEPIPVRVSATISDSIEAVEPTMPSAEPIHVLAVEDEPVQRKILVRSLAQEGFRITLANNGREALKLALEQAPDIVLADYVMPEMDGLELCRMLRRTEAGSKMYYIVLTSRTEPEVLISAFDAGADDFVTKPYAQRLLLARIKAGVRLVNLQRKVDADRVTMQRQLAELGVLTRKLRNVAMTDALTGLPNRRYAMKRLESEWAFTQRTARPLTLIMVDIDHFKKVNDNYGHEAGDLVLVETSRALKDCLRETDEVCRLGGEEFLILCRNTPPEDGAIVAERLRKAVADQLVEGAGYSGRVTVSLGVAGWRPGTESVMTLLRRADEAVYEAKRHGRNCYVIATPGEVQHQKSA